MRLYEPGLLGRLQQNASLNTTFKIMLTLWLSLSCLSSMILALTAQGNSTIVASWYTSWHAQNFPLNQVSWSKYSHVIYSFGCVLPLLVIQILQFRWKLYRVTTPNISTLGFTSLDLTLLPQFVNYARNHVTFSNRCL